MRRKELSSADDRAAVLDWRLDDTRLQGRAGTDGHLRNRGTTTEDRLLYRVPEGAVILNISRSKVYELFSSGDLEIGQD